MEPRLDGTVKVFDLTAKEVDWIVAPTISVKAWAYNGSMSGPLIRVTEGDTVRVALKNELPENTALHFRGVMLPNARCRSAT